jgi:hypothetical protein
VKSLAGATITYNSGTFTASITGITLNMTDYFKITVTNVHDIAGNNIAGSNSFTGTVSGVDTTPPTGTISVNTNATYTTNASVTLTISASDVSGVAQMAISNTGTTWTTVAYATTYNNWVLTAGDGNKTVYIKFKDNANNWNTSAAASDSIILDTAAPSGSIQINGNAVFTTTTAVTLNINATDATSGMYQMRFSSDNVTWTSPEAYNTTKPWTLTGADGSKPVYVQFLDNAGNWSGSSNDTIKLCTAHHLKVELNAVNPSEIKGGDIVTLKISARHADDSISTGYLNLVGFTDTDTNASAISDYQFNGVEVGGYAYVPISLKTIGDQTVEVNDKDIPTIIKGSIVLTVYEIATIGAAGGTITNPDGTEITIPAGMFTAGKDLAIRKTRNPSTLPNSYQYKNTVKPISRDFGEIDRTTVPWTLSHINFTSAIEIKMPYAKTDIGDMDETSLRIFFYDDINGKYIIVPGAQEINNGKVVANTPHFSTFRIIGTYLTTSLSNVIGYPSPFKPATAFAGKFKVINLPQDAEMSVYTIAGEKVKTLEETDMQFPNTGYVEWDGKNESGETVAKGVYLYLLKCPDGSKKSGKIGLIK